MCSFLAEVWRRARSCEPACCCLTRLSSLTSVSFIHRQAAYLLLQPGCVLGYRVSHLCETPERNSAVGWMWKLVADETNCERGGGGSHNFLLHIRYWWPRLLLGGSLTDVKAACCHLELHLLHYRTEILKLLCGAHIHRHARSK